MEFFPNKGGGWSRFPKHLKMCLLGLKNPTFLAKNFPKLSRATDLGKFLKHNFFSCFPLQTLNRNLQIEFISLCAAIGFANVLGSLGKGLLPYAHSFWPHLSLSAVCSFVRLSDNGNIYTSFFLQKTAFSLVKSRLALGSPS